MLFSLVSWLSGNPAFTIASLTLITIFLIENLRFNIALSAVKKLQIERCIVAPRLQVGRQTEVTLKLSNPTSRPTGYFVIKDEVPAALAIESGMPRVISVKAHESVKTTYSIRAIQMGDYEIANVAVITSDVSGFSTFTISHPVRNKVEVYPRLQLMQVMRTRVALRMTSIGEKPTSESGAGSDFRGIREYYPGDAFKHIVWKAVAKSSEHSLMTREFESGRTLNTVLAVHEKKSLLDGPVGHRKLDYMIEAILAMTHAAALEGDRVVFAFGNTSHTLAFPSHGKQQLVRAIRTIYNIQPTRTEPVQTLTASLLRDVRQRSLIVVITDTEGCDPQDFQTLSQLLHHHSVHVVALRTTPLFPNPNLKDHAVKKGHDLILHHEQTALEQLANSCARLRVPFNVCSPNEFSGVVLKIYLDAKKKVMIAA